MIQSDFLLGEIYENVLAIKSVHKVTVEVLKFVIITAAAAAVKASVSVGVKVVAVIIFFFCLADRLTKSYLDVFFIAVT